MPFENPSVTAVPESDLERCGERLLLYLGSLPLSESQRLETAAEILRDLQEHPPAPGTSPEAEAMRRLHLRLGEGPQPLFPAAGPSLVRGHMRPEEMDRRPWWTAMNRLFHRLKLRLGLPEGHPDHLTHLPRPKIESEYYNEPWCRIASYRRIVLAILVLVPALLAGPVFATLLPHKGNSLLEIALVVVFALLFAWISVGFWTAMLGFVTLCRRFDRMVVTHFPHGTKPPAIRSGVRTAILFPVCNEEMSRVCAGITATCRSLEQTGQSRAFDLFILSDTSNPDAWVEEEIAWHSLCRELGDGIRVFYRNRRINLKRKSGNVADFCRRFGHHYTYMVVMDADSVMSGPTLVRMVSVMERQRRVGILQSAPAVTGRETLLARLQQFCSRAYGPMFAAGLASMQLGDAQFWGHNAIIRVKPFMHHCGLPRLPGKPPLGGDILSHDFVESALMRRAGWGVWLGYDLAGSYEETPPTLLAELKRDRRWCTGNLQHLRLVFTRGLFPTHRVLFLNGAMSYISAFLWFLLLLLSTIEAVLIAITEPVYFPLTRSLFPLWPVWDPYWPLLLLGATAVLLFLPKLFSAFLILVKGRVREFGGIFSLVFSILTEVVISTLLAPIRMLFHTKFVFFILLGRQSGWGSQQRDDSGTTWGDAIRFHAAGTLFALLWGGLLYLLNPAFLLWISPIIGSLLLSIPLSVWTSRAGLGRLARRLRLFLTPEEIAPPRELQEMAASEEHFARLPSPLDLPQGAGFAKAVLDPAVHALHLALLARKPRSRRPDIRQRHRDLMHKALEQGPEHLSPREKKRLLFDAETLQELHLRVWELPEAELRERWRLARL
jgi:membrane glycosyltransferase